LLRSRPLLLVIEITMLVAGITALVTGKFTLALFKGPVVQGTAARVAGAIFLLPIPLALTAGIALGVVAAAQGKPWGLEFQIIATAIEAGIVLVCLALATVVCAGASAEPKRYGRSRRPEDEPAEVLPAPSARRAQSAAADDDTDEHDRYHGDEDERKVTARPTWLVPAVMGAAVVVTLILIPGLAWVMMPQNRAKPDPVVVKVIPGRVFGPQGPQGGLEPHRGVPIPPRVPGRPVVPAAPAFVPPPPPDLSPPGQLSVKVRPPVGRPPSPVPAQPPAPTPRADGRPPFDNAVARRVTLDGGTFSIRGQFGPADPAYRDQINPAKLFLIPLKAGETYLVVVKSVNLFATNKIRLRLEDSAGKQVAWAETDNSREPVARLLYKPTTADTYRLVAVSESIPNGGFTLKIDRLQDGDLPPGNGLDGAPASRTSLQVSRQIDMYLAAAVAPDGKSAWVATTDGKLVRYACPDFQPTVSHKLPAPAYTLAVGRGVLAAVVARLDAPAVVPKARPRPGARRPPQSRPDFSYPRDAIVLADLHLYDLAALEKKAASLPPAKVIPLSGIVEDLAVSPDGQRFYFLDRHASRLGRIDAATRAVDRDTPDLAPGTKSMCLTPDGKAIYTCTDTTKVQRIDPETLAVTRTVLIDRGRPNGIQATNSGTVFLKSGEDQWTHIYAVDTTGNGAAGRAEVVPWVRVYQSSDLRLAPDGRRLYVSCFHLSPSNIQMFPVGRRPLLVEGHEGGALEINANGAARGRMAISPDGSFLFCDRGLIVSLGR
jgi:hypothetical protein